MKTAEPDIANKANRVIAAQLLTSVIVAVLFSYQGVEVSAAALYGGLASVIIALLLRRGVQRANDAVLTDPAKSMAILYLGAVQRFILVLMVLAFGFGFLKLNPIAMIVGFALAQASYLIMSARQSK